MLNYEIWAINAMRKSIGTGGKRDVNNQVRDRKNVISMLSMFLTRCLSLILRRS